jgi:hypothetical protein
MPALGTVGTTKVAGSVTSGPVRTAPLPGSRCPANELVGRALVGLGLAWPMICHLGCGSSSLPDRARVEGQVTLDGQPLTTGTILFVPDAARGTNGPPAIGFIDAEGHYRLTTDRRRSGDGAVVGFHKVGIEARDSAEPGAVSRSLVPPQYADPETSGLTAEVQAGRVNKIDFPLSGRLTAGR